MGNRAIVRGKGQTLGVYLHWNGGYESVRSFTEYCKLKGYRSPETDNYGIARFCQVVGNFFGGGLSLGIMKIDRNLNPEIVDSYCLDNGVYEIENWEIVAHWNSEIIEDDDLDPLTLRHNLLEINKAQPESERLGEDFIMADEVDVNSLKIGDKVYVQRYDDSIEIHTVMGFDEVNDLPYVDLYDHDGDWSWNQNNYIRTDTIRKVDEQKQERITKSMKKLFVSVPMKGRTEADIKASIEKMKKIAEAYEGEELELIDSYVEDNPPQDNNQAIWYLGKSLENLSTADIFIGITDDYNWNGCYIESMVAERYNIKRYAVPPHIVIENYYEILKETYSDNKCCSPA